VGEGPGVGCRRPRSRRRVGWVEYIWFSVGFCRIFVGARGGEPVRGASAASLLLLSDDARNDRGNHCDTTVLMMMPAKPFFSSSEGGWALSSSTDFSSIFHSQLVP
jgi:hypothetical protein